MMRLPFELVEIILDCVGSLKLVCQLEIQKLVSKRLRDSLSLRCTPRDIGALFDSGFVHEASRTIGVIVKQNAATLRHTSRQRSAWRRTLDKAIVHGVDNSILLELCRFGQLGVSQGSMMTAVQADRFDTLRALFHCNYWFHGSWWLALDGMDDDMSWKYFSPPLAMVINESGDEDTMHWMRRQAKHPSLDSLRFPWGIASDT